jgi:predicted amidohydrolase
MRVSMGQMQSGTDKTDNLRQIREMTKAAAGAGADLVVFPEFAMYEQHVVDKTYVAAAEPLDGPFTRELRSIAQDNQITVVAGMLEEVPGEDRGYNTVFVSDRDGKYVTHYRKVHLYDAFGIRESDIVKPSEATEPVTFSVGGVTVGLITCYDLRFPEIARDLVDHGAELLLLPSSWTPGPRKEDHWNVLSRARAIENTVYLLAVSQAPPLSTGGSLFIDPMGIVLGELGEEPAVGTYDVDLERIGTVRLKNPSLTDRRYSVTRSR